MVPELTFEITAGGLSVHVDRKIIGYISKEQGFFTDSTASRAFIRIAPENFREIADKVDEIQGRLTTVDMMVLHILNSTRCLPPSDVYKTIGLFGITLRQAHSSIEKLEKLGRIENVNKKGVHPLYAIVDQAPK